MINSVNSTGAEPLGNADGSEMGFNVEVASWADPIAQYGANAETLGDLLDNLEAALKDPEKAAVLASYGITQEYIDDRRAGLDDIAVYDHEEWDDLFGKLESIGMQGTFGMGSMARLNLLDLGVNVVATNVATHQASSGEQEYANTASTMMEALAADADPGEPIVLSDEIVDLLISSGITEDDVSSPQLKAILRGEDPSTIEFTPDELNAAAEEVSEVALVQATETESELLLELQTAQNYRMEAYALASATSKKLFDAQMDISNKLGSS